MVIEEMNKQRILDDLHKKENGLNTPKTKTLTIVNKIKDREYSRKPEPEILLTTKHEAKTIVIARYGMLVCGVNFKGTMPSNCGACCVKDDENHRMNICPKWKDPQKETTENLDFKDVYSNNIETIRPIISVINHTWNTKTSNGTMREHVSN